MWDELEHYTTYHPTCVKDTTEYKKHVENIQILKFLVRLNPKYEQVRALILGNKSLLSLNEVYTHIHHDDRCQVVMNPSPSIEKSAFVSTSTRGGRGGNSWCGHGGRQSFTSNDKDRLKCEHCGRSRHTKEQCWNLHGRPTDLPPRPFQRCGSGSGRGGGRFGTSKFHAHLAASTPTKMTSMAPASVPSSSSDEGLFSNEIAVFRHFVSQLGHLSNAPTSSSAYSGTSASILSTSISSPQCSWIIASRASHHITGMSSFFTSYSINFGNDKVRIADGSLSSMARHGDIPVTRDLCLSSVLHIPKFTL